MFHRIKLKFPQGINVKIMLKDYVKIVLTLSAVFLINLLFCMHLIANILTQGNFLSKTVPKTTTHLSILYFFNTLKSRVLKFKDNLS